MARSWRVELPPSLGRESMRARARELAAVLHDAGVAEVGIAASYQALETAVSTGAADAAWAPPLLCARLERIGARVALRALRGGAASYRSVLLCRVGDQLTLDADSLRRRRPRVAWVDSRSMGGFILARAALGAIAGSLAEVFADEAFLGSYQACVGAVLDGDADLTATFADVGGAQQEGFRTLAGPRADELRAVGYSAECPNDGVVLSPRLDDHDHAQLSAALLAIVEHPPARAQLASVFSVSGFEEPPRGSYVPLLGLYAHALLGLDLAKEAV